MYNSDSTYDQPGLTEKHVKSPRVDSALESLNVLSDLCLVEGDPESCVQPLFMTAYSSSPYFASE